MPSSLFLVVGLVVSFGLPAIDQYRRRTMDDPDWGRIRRGLVRNWIVLLALTGLVAVFGGPGDLGIRIPSVGVFVDGALFGFVAFAGTMLLVGLAYRFVGDDVVANPASLVVFEQSWSRRLAVAITGTIVETTLFYGFVLEALLSLGGGPWVAGAGATAGLLLVRARWSSRNAVQWLPGAMVLSAIALWSRTILVVALVRFVYDSVTLLSGDPSDYSRLSDA